MNPLRDIDVVMDEMLRIDRATAQREVMPLEKMVEKKEGGSSVVADWLSMERVRDFLDLEQRPLRSKEDWEDQDKHVIHRGGFITAKEVVVVVNMSARDYLRGLVPGPGAHAAAGSLLSRVRARCAEEHGGCLVLPYSGEFESRLERLRDGLDPYGPPHNWPHYRRQGGSPAGDEIGEPASRDSIPGVGGRKGLKAFASSSAASPLGGSRPATSSRPVTGASGASSAPSFGGGGSGAGFGGEEALERYLAANPTHVSARESVMRHALWAIRLIHFFTVSKEEVILQHCSSRGSSRDLLCIQRRSQCRVPVRVVRVRWGWWRGGHLSSEPEHTSRTERRRPL